MNSIADAMKIAGVRIPSVDRRIHHWLKDHPGKMAPDIVSALKINAATAATMLRRMRAGGDLTTTVDRKPCDNFAGYVYVLRYTVARKEYEGIDYRKAARPSRAKATVVVLPTTASRVMPEQTAVTTAKPKHVLAPVAPPIITLGPTPGTAVNVEMLTIGEARALYLKLKEYFGGAL